MAQQFEDIEVQGKYDASFKAVYTFCDCAVKFFRSKAGEGARKSTDEVKRRHTHTKSIAQTNVRNRDFESYHFSTELSMHITNRESVSLGKDKTERSKN